MPVPYVFAVSYLAIAPAIVDELLLPLFCSAIKYLACLVQPIQAVVEVLLVTHRLAGNVNFLLSQVAVVVAAYWSLNISRCSWQL